MDEQKKWYYQLVYFFVAHQVFLKRLGAMLLILFNIFLWANVWTKFIAYTSSTPAYRQLLADLTVPESPWANYLKNSQPQELQILGTYQIKTDKNSYDLVAKINNPNLQWQVRRLDYVFVVDGLPLTTMNTFVLPGQQKFLWHFAYLSDNYPGVVELKIENVQWQKFKDKDLLNALNNLVVEQENFISERGNSELSLEIINNNNFGWWQTGWQVILYQGDYPEAVNYVSLEKFLAGQTRPLKVSWLEALSTPSRIEIIPDIDLLETNNYIWLGDNPESRFVRGTTTSVQKNK